MKDIWLKGGPFLEISFVIKNSLPKKELVKYIFDSFLEFGFKCNNENYEDLFNEFEIGWLWNENDPNSASIYSVKFSFNYNISGERLCNLLIYHLSNQLSSISLLFYDGGGTDADEWGQKCIKDEDIDKFFDLFKNIYRYFKFPIGTISIENDCLDLFGEIEMKDPRNYIETEQNEKYNLDNIKINEESMYYYLGVIANNNFLSDNVKYEEIIGEGKFIFISKDSNNN